MCKFELGKIYMTSLLNYEYEGTFNVKKEVDNALQQYMNCEWGELCEEDKKMNDDAIISNDDRILAKYHLNSIDKDIYIITEWDRSYTTLLFCEEY